MSNPQNLQLGPYLGGAEETAKSLKKKGNKKSALGIMRATRTPKRGLRRKTQSPTTSQNSQYGSVYSGNAVMGTSGGVRGFVNATTGMVWDPNSKTWVNAPSPSKTVSSRVQKALSNTASSILKPFKPDRARRVSKVRSIQSALSYDPKFGKRVRNLQENITRLENELQQANRNGNQGLVRQKRVNINRRTEEIVNLVNKESQRLQDVYKNLGTNFNTTPKNKLKKEPGALRRMINKILGTQAKVSFSVNRGPSERSLAGIAGASARRARGRLPAYGGRRGTASIARAGGRRTGLPILLPPPQ